jgi:uncharacterized protein
MTPPGNSTSRIVELDALRGLAVIGIAWMNVYVFALPLQAYYNPAAWGFQGGFDHAAWWSGFVLVEDKFRTLFAMLFGAGVAMLLERDHANPWRGHFLRMAVLFAIGILHATLLASNDILRVYAMAGLALPFFMRLGSRALLIAGAALVGLHMAGGIYWLREAFASWASGANDPALAFFDMNYGANPLGVELAYDRGQEEFGQRLARRIVTIPQSLGTVAASLPLNLATMLVGIALWRNGLLAAQWPIRRLRRFGAGCALIALPALIALAAWEQAEEFPGVLVAANSLVFSAPFDLLLGIAYAAFAMALFGTCRERAPVKRLAATGRLSLTNYLMTSLVFSILFASWGVGLFGELSRAQALALSLVPAALILAWSPLWLERFRQGPFEWLWRGIACARFGQIRR